MTRANRCRGSTFFLLLAIVWTSYALKPSLRLPLKCSKPSITRLNAVDPNVISSIPTVLAQASTVVTAGGGIMSLFGTDGSALGWLSILDFSRFPFLPIETKAFLASLPVFVRMGLGVLAFDLLPTIIDIVFLRFLWTKFIAVRPSNKDIDISGLPKTYDVDKIAEYYKKNPRLVLARGTEIFMLAKDFLLGLFADYRTGKLKSNQPMRAVQFTELITTLGPAFIKIGQALSIRPDLASPAYLDELIKLQDQVPPFSSDEALRLISRELNGKDPADVFESLSAFEKPVAAASLGQVYKARMKGSGTPVAVKIQRPDMLLTVTLDLYIVRQLFTLGTYIPLVAEECKGLIMVVDNWAGRFVDELDYRQEVKSSEKFRVQMSESSSSLGGAIVVPRAYLDYCSDTLLVMQWVEGTKLSKIDTATEKGKEIVRRLTRVLLNAYLVQLLETGFLHADPHPGNFLVTNEGNVCILDYGLMTTVDEDKRFGLLEFVANLLAKDYDAVFEGLVVLEFVPPEVAADPAKRKIIQPVLSRVFEQVANGGGAFNIDVEAIVADVGSVAGEYPLVIPPYFGLILRAFGALEGLGLSVDKDYSIVNECFPYLSRRLLSDDSIRIRKALRTFLYGTKGRLDIDRVDELAEGYRTFARTAEAASTGKAFEELMYKSSDSTTTVIARAPSSSAKNAPAAAAPVDSTISSAARILFSAQGNYVQELLLDEAVRIADALSRSIVTSAVAAATSQPLVVGSLLFRNAIVGGAASLLPPQLQSVSLGLKQMSPFFPFSTAAAELEGVFKLSSEDIDSLRTLKRLLQIIAGVDPAERRKKENSVNSEGLIEAEDFALVQQVLIQFSAQLKPEQWPTAALAALGIEDRRGKAPPISPEQMRAKIMGLIPLLTDCAPGAASLVIRFGKRMVGRGLGRIANRLGESKANAQFENQ